MADAYPTPKRMILNGPDQQTHSCDLFSSSDRAFDVSISGTFGGSIILEADYGDGIWCYLASYDVAMEDYGRMSVSKMSVRLRTSADFSGDAACLIAQNNKLYDSEEV